MTKPKTTKRKWNFKRRFSYHISQIERLITKHVGTDNYAGHSSIAQLDNIYEKFMDCASDTIPNNTNKNTFNKR